MAKQLLIFHPEAQKELDEATAWYHEKNKVVRDRFEEQFKSRANLIIQHPERCKKTWTLQGNEIENLFLPDCIPVQ
jgi:plasmid stabilization system protein ParE